MEAVFVELSINTRWPGGGEREHADNEQIWLGCNYELRNKATLRKEQNWKEKKIKEQKDKEKLSCVLVVNKLFFSRILLALMNWQ